MIVCQRADGEWDCVYSYDYTIAPEPVLAQVHHELGVGELTMRPEQFEEDKPWLLLQRGDRAVIEGRLGVGEDEAIETGDFDFWEVDPTRRDHEVQYLVCLNAIRNLMRANPESSRFVLSEYRE